MTMIGGSGHFGQELGAEDTLSGTLSQTTVPKRKKKEKGKSAYHRGRLRDGREAGDLGSGKWTLVKGLVCAHFMSGTQS